MWKELTVCNLYEVSDDGRVRRKDNLAVLSGKVVKGRRWVRLTNAKGNHPKYPVDRLVALHFLDQEPPAVKPYVDHLDGNLLNNKAENLVWITKAEYNQRCYNEVQERKKAERRANCQPVPVIQFLDGKEIARYGSIKKASLATGIPVPEIAKCIHGKAEKAGPFIWKRQ